MSEFISDILLLKALSNRSIYDKYVQSIPVTALEYETSRVIKAYESYYATFPAEEIDFEVFQSWFHLSLYPDMTESELLIYNAIFNRVHKQELNLEYENIFVGLQERLLQRKIVELCDSNFDIEKVKDMIEKHQKAVGTINDLSATRTDNSLDNLLDSIDRSGGLKFRLLGLQEGLTSLIKGDFGIIAASVGCGKTALAISEAVYMAKQITEGHVLWLNNEEFDKRVFIKIWKSALNCSQEDLENNKAAATKRYTEIMHGDLNRIELINIGGWDVTKIKQLLAQKQPKLVIIDRLDKLEFDGKSKFQEYQYIEKIAYLVRQLAQEFCPILGIMQTDASTVYFDRESGETKYIKYPNLNNLYKSKVGAPGEADFVITIGQDNTNKNIRGIHLAKNKVGPQGLQFETTVDLNHCRYTDN